MASNNRSKAAKAVLSGDTATLMTALVAGTAKAGRAAYREALGDAAASVHIAATDDLRIKAFTAAILPLINKFGAQSDLRARAVKLIMDDRDADGRAAVVLAKHLAVFCDKSLPVVAGVGEVSGTNALKVREVKGKLPESTSRTDKLDLLRAWKSLDGKFFHGQSVTALFLMAMVQLTAADAAEVADAAVAVAA